MKYQLKPETAILDKDGITTTAGWVLIYNVNSNTGEFIGVTYQYLPIGVGLPAYSYLDAPKSVEEGKAIVRQGSKWIYPNDYRGQNIYATETGIKSVMQDIGDIPDGYTLLKPDTNFDSWDGEKWLLDNDKQHQYYIKIALAQKNRLLNEASAQISYLQDAIDSKIATDDEKALYVAWKKYRALLNRVDVNFAPEISWPKNPLNGGVK
jgi:Caudovirales tail fibre assembly protein.